MSNQPPVLSCRSAVCHSRCPDHRSNDQHVYAVVRDTQRPEDIHRQARCKCNCSLFVGQLISHDLWPETLTFIARGVTVPVGAALHHPPPEVDVPDEPWFCTDGGNGRHARRRARHWRASGQHSIHVYGRWCHQPSRRWCSPGCW